MLIIFKIPPYRGLSVAGNGVLVADGAVVADGVVVADGILVTDGAVVADGTVVSSLVHPLKINPLTKMSVKNRNRSFFIISLYLHSKIFAGISFSLSIF